MSRRGDNDDDRGDPQAPRYDAPGWIKAAIAVVASLVWGFTVIVSVNAGRPIDPLVHAVFIAVLGVVFGIDFKRWNR